MLKETFKPYLLPGETIVWCDRPRQGIMLAPRDALMIPFSLLWGGFAIFWETTVLSMPAPWFFKLFGIPFVLVGLFLIFGRFLLDAWLRSKTAYALTEQRILIRRSGPWPSFNALGLDRLPESTLIEAAHGRGTIRFGQAAPSWGNRRAGSGLWIASLDSTPQFLAIDKAREVFATIQQRARKPPLPA